METSLSRADLENRFGFITVDLKQEELRETLLEMAEYLNNTLPEGRDKVMALDFLQTSAMWAHSALAGPEPEIVEETPAEPTPSKRASKKKA